MLNHGNLSYTTNYDQYNTTLREHSLLQQSCVFFLLLLLLNRKGDFFTKRFSVGYRFVYFSRFFFVCLFELECMGCVRHCFRIVTILLLLKSFNHYLFILTIYFILCRPFYEVNTHLHDLLTFFFFFLFRLVLF